MKMTISEINDMVDILDKVILSMSNLNIYMQEIATSGEDEEFRKKLEKVMDTDVPLWTLKICCESLRRECNRWYELSQKKVDVDMLMKME